MEMEVKQDNGILLIKPLGSNIDAVVNREFKGKIIDLVNQGNNFLILNLSKVEFMDSSGLGNLISILKLLAHNKGNIVICEAREEIIKLFNLTRLSQVFHLYQSEEEALKFLKEISSGDKTNE